MVRASSSERRGGVRPPCSTRRSVSGRPEAPAWAARAVASWSQVTTPFCSAIRPKSRSRGPSSRNGIGSAPGPRRRATSVDARPPLRRMSHSGPVPMLHGLMDEEKGNRARGGPLCPARAPSPVARGLVRLTQQRTLPIRGGPKAEYRALLRLSPVLRSFPCSRSTSFDSFASPALSSRQGFAAGS